MLNGFAFDAKWSTALYTSLIVGVFILSIVVLTGYAGQLSLAQYAIGGLGALVASRLVGQEQWPAELAFLAGRGVRDPRRARSSPSPRSAPAG